MIRLIWDAVKRRYRDASTNRLLTDSQVRQLRDDLADTYADRLEALVNAYVDGKMQQERFEREFLQTVSEAAIEGYVMGRGGAAAMTDADYDDLATLVAEQEQYARGFFADIERELARFLDDPPVSGGEHTETDTTAHEFISLPIGAIREGVERGVRWTKRTLLKLLRPQIAARARMYSGVAVHGFERGKTRAAGLPELPGYPADGGTECLVMCRCWWEFTETEFSWEAYWQTERDGSVCPGCKQREERWSPYTIAK